MMLHKLMLLVAGASAVVLIMPADAATVVNVGSVAADFFDANAGVANPAYYNVDGRPGNEGFSWGTPAETINNSLTFLSGATQFVGLDSQFTIGSISVVNHPTYGVALSSIDLSLAIPVGIGGNNYTPSPFLFDLSYDDTPNRGMAANCKYQSTVPCADALTVTVLNGSGSFVNDGINYTLYLDGFRDSAGAFSTTFIAQENGTSAAQVIGHFGEAITSSVPEAGTWGMMIMGMGAIGLAMRRRKVGTTVSFA